MAFHSRKLSESQSPRSQNVCHSDAFDEKGEHDWNAASDRADGSQQSPVYTGTLRNSGGGLQFWLRSPGPNLGKPNNIRHDIRFSGKTIHGQIETAAYYVPPNTPPTWSRHCGGMSCNVASNRNIILAVVICGVPYVNHGPGKRKGGLRSTIFVLGQALTQVMAS